MGYGGVGGGATWGGGGETWRGPGKHGQYEQSFFPSLFRRASEKKSKRNPFSRRLSFFRTRDGISWERGTARSLAWGHHGYYILYFNSENSCCLSS